MIIRSRKNKTEKNKVENKRSVDHVCTDLSNLQEGDIIAQKYSIVFNDKKYKIICYYKKTLDDDDCTRRINTIEIYEDQDSIFKLVYTYIIYGDNGRFCAVNRKDPFQFSFWCDKAWTDFYNTELSPPIVYTEQLKNLEDWIPTIKSESIIEPIKPISPKKLLNTGKRPMTVRDCVIDPTVTLSIQKKM